MSDLKVGDLVVLDESTKPYKNGALTLEIKSNDFINGILLDVDHHSTAKVDTLDGFHLFINIDHLKPKEQLMQNYKIKVTPNTSEEAQELFFELGYSWYYRRKEVTCINEPYLFAESDGYIRYDNDKDFYTSDENQEITLPQLRDLVVLKRNDVADATHAIFSTKYYVGYDVYEWKEGEWHKSDFETQTIKVGGCSLKSDAEMTWQDALDAVKDGKSVEFYSNLTYQWHNIEICTISSIKNSDRNFRLKPKTIHIESGDYTKEQFNSLLEKFND